MAVHAGAPLAVLVAFPERAEGRGIGRQFGELLGVGESVLNVIGAVVFAGVPLSTAHDELAGGGRDVDAAQAQLLDGILKGQGGTIGHCPIMTPTDGRNQEA